MVKVQLQGVCKVYDNGQVVVKDVSFEVVDGELMVLVGLFGCGKLILLWMVVGLEEISGGMLIIGDCVVNDVVLKDCDIVMVFQSYVLYLYMIVVENLVFGLKLCGYDKVIIDKCIVEVVQMLGLIEMMDKLFKVMFGGQCQCVVLGWVLVCELVVFLFDELLFNFDVKLCYSVCIEIVQLYCKLGIIMIYVMYDQVEVMMLGQCIVVLKDGIIQQIDMLMVLYDCLVNLFVVGFFGSLVMNVLCGMLQGDVGGVSVVDGEWCVLLGQVMINLVWLQKLIVVGVWLEYLQFVVVDDVYVFIVCIEGIELVGNEIFVNLSSGQYVLIMCVVLQVLLVVGEQICVVIYLQGLYFFNVESGECL